MKRLFFRFLALSILLLPVTAFFSLAHPRMAAAHASAEHRIGGTWESEDGGWIMNIDVSNPDNATATLIGGSSISQCNPVGQTIWQGLAHTAGDFDIYWEGTRSIGCDPSDPNSGVTDAPLKWEHGQIEYQMGTLLQTEKLIA